MTFRIAVCLSIAAALLDAPASLAADWTQFRGPTGQGHSSARGLPVRWSPTENVRWKVEVPGEGWSSPIVAGDRVYLTTAVATGDAESRDRSLRTMCLDAADGKTVWDVEVFAQRHETTDRIHRKNSHASPTPITDGEYVYVHFGTQGTACLSLDGEIVWKTRELKYQPRHGNGGSPILVDDRLFVSCDGLDVQFVAALDKATGEIRWKRERPEVPNPSKFSFSTPSAIEVDGRKQIVSPGTDAVIAYDPRDGDEIWRVRYTGYSVIPRPVYAHGLVFVSTSYNTPSLLAIRPTGTGDVTDTHVAWSIDRGVPHTPSMLVVGDELYFVSDRGIASCVDARTGEVHWQQRLGGNYSASPLYADGRIYFQSEQGDTTVIEPGPEYTAVAESELGERTLASYAVVESDLLVRSERHLYRFGE